MCASSAVMVLVPMPLPSTSIRRLAWISGRVPSPLTAATSRSACCRLFASSGFGRYRNTPLRYSSLASVTLFSEPVTRIIVSGRHTCMIAGT